jgi:hypothetical protein
MNRFEAYQANEKMTAIIRLNPGMSLREALRRGREFRVKRDLVRHWLNGAPSIGKSGKRALPGGQDTG